jgi:ferrous iron transport protein B
MGANGLPSDSTNRGALSPSPSHPVTLSPSHLVTQGRRPTIALLGNPNTGKTTLFNALAGMRQRVGNYPGVTVETKKGQMIHAGQTFDLIDLPGTYSLAARSPDEMVAVDLVLGQQAGESRPDVVLTLVDASNLERNLYLTTQALELGVPVVVALNMIDVAHGQGIRIDAQELSLRLGVPVVPIQANKKKNLHRLKQTLALTAGGDLPAKQTPFPEAFEREATGLHDSLKEDLPAFLARRLLLDVGGYTEQRLAQRHGEHIRGQVQAARQRLTEAQCAVPGVEAKARYGWIRLLTTGCVQRPPQRPVTWTDRIDRVLTHKVWGTLVFLTIMFLVFQSIFTWAQPVMDLISGGVDWLGDQLTNLLPPGPLTSLLVDGMLKGVGAVIVFLPQIVILFGFLAVLEDCGYMARAAFLMDKLMARCGLSGKSFIPMLSSVACAVPGIMATRVIENRRDRLATILVAPLMSCSARLPVYILLIGTFLTAGYPRWVPGLTLFAMYSIGLVVAPLVALALKRTLLRGETPVFVMEMPLYKVPSLRTVVRRMLDSGWAFLRRAGTLILMSMILVWALMYFPRGGGDGETYDVRVAHMQSELNASKERPDPDDEAIQKKIDDQQDEIDKLRGEWKRQSVLGHMGQAIEPAVRPLGWDWKIGMAALASFPAREVVVGTLGIIYNQGQTDSKEIRTTGNVAGTKLGQALEGATWDDDPERKVFTVPTALSLMVFFALCCQCASTLAVIRRETRSWRWPAFTFVYMTVLAYIGALVVYQVGSLL